MSVYALRVHFVSSEYVISVFFFSMIMHCISYETSMRAKYSVCFNCDKGRILGEDFARKDILKPHWWPWLLPFWSLCGSIVSSPSFAARFLGSFILWQSSSTKEMITFVMWISVSLPRHTG